MLLKLLKDVFVAEKSEATDSSSSSSASEPLSGVAGRAIRRVLNVGGNNKEIPIPPYYEGWDHLLLDIDPRGDPDIVCDARLLGELAPQQFGAIYCSHNLEHYFQHDAVKVLAGFHHVLKDDGFVDIRVPDMGALMRLVVANGMDIEDLLYESPAGPIHVIDVMYGLRSEIEGSGHDFFSHKTGFTEKSLTRHLSHSGFAPVFTSCANLEVRAIAFKSTPTDYALSLLGLGGEASGGE